MAGREGTEAPTDKKKREARKEGRIARSTDLTGWLAIVVGVAMLPTVARGEMKVFRNAISRIGNPDVMPLSQALGETLWEGFKAAMPLLMGVWVAVMVAIVAQVGFVLTGKALKPKSERVNPLKNAKRLVGLRGVVELVKQMAKASVVVLLVWSVVRSTSSQLVLRGGEDAQSGLGFVYGRVAGAVRNVAIAGVILGVMDFAYQKWQLRKDLRMTKQEIRDEMRQSEGDPLVKQRIRTLQREAARRRMLTDVESATTVLVNPTHIAVALRYRPGVDVAPVIVAVGRGAVAKRIRERALEHRVPIVRAVSLARALEKHCQIGDEVPSQLFEAVARVLAFIARVGRRVSWAGVMDLPVAWETKIPEMDSRRRRRR
jgi:flagellar biosynthetic protein FlhB